MSLPKDGSWRDGPPLWFGIILSVALVALMGLVRLGVASETVLPIGYGVPVVLAAWLRNRRLLWGMAAAFAIITIVKFWFLIPDTGHVSGINFYHHHNWAGVLVLVDLLAVSIMVHLWIGVRLSLEERNQALEQNNHELAAREEEIARQNEELQSQTEELERQAEELRVVNEELSRREHALEALLQLSRALSAEMSVEETTTRICEAVGRLLDGQGIGSAILERQGNEMKIRCHHGFGPAGLQNDSIPVDRSFASLIAGRGQSGYIEDLSLRPELQVPQPRDGKKYVSVLAAPLRTGRRITGTIEVYATTPTKWDADQIAIVESLGAQASISLETASLFQRVDEERARFETVVQTVPFGVIVASADGSDVRVNPAGSIMLKLAPNANLGDAKQQQQLPRWQVTRLGQDISHDFPVRKSALQGEKSEPEEIEISFPNGTRLELISSSAPIRDSLGHVVGAVAAFVDVTPLKSLQRELDARRREAEELSDRKSRFLAAVSHDIRTPANAISLLAELMQRTSSNPAMAAEVPQMAKELHASALSLVNLVSDVLDITRLDVGKVGLQESELDLGDLLREECRQLLPLARKKELEFVCEPPQDVLRVRGDRVKLGRIIGNLVGNAIKFTEHGQVVVEADRQSDGSIQMRVTDTGIGIPAEHQSRIFDEFFQLRYRERDSENGSGLGLTISKRLVETMGGTMTVTSEMGKGSTFTVTLPPHMVIGGAPRAAGAARGE